MKGENSLLAAGWYGRLGRGLPTVILAEYFPRKKEDKRFEI